MEGRAMDVQELLSKVSQSLSVGRSFGAPYEKDGAMIIPVALVAGGGGGGEGTGPSAPDSGDESVGGGADPADQMSDVASGSGGGFGGLVLPVGAYVVKDGNVRWVPALNVNLVVVAGLATLRMIIRARQRARRHRG
jgi:uncharacterized spore protein YtfJ